VAAGYDALSVRLIVGAALVVASVVLPDIARGRGEAESVQNGASALSRNKTN
jgi:hypothetical protein